MSAPIFRSEAGRQAILHTYEQLLQRWPLPFARREFSTRVGMTHAIDCAPEAHTDAPPVILLHGSASNAAMWGGHAAALGRTRRVVAVDIPGEAGFSAAVRPELSAPDYAGWMEDVLDFLEAPRAALVGISLGGWMAVKFAAAFPQRVERLALLCPAGIGGQKASFLWKALPLMLLGDWGMRFSYRDLNGGRDLDAETLRVCSLISHNFNPRMESIPLFSDEELRRLNMPVLMIAGDRDPLLDSRASTRRLGSLLPHAAVHLLPGEGHILVNQVQRLEEFLQV